jgi:fructose-1,6-bisphosphatase/inositol monophosphatase family enzyme
MVCTSIGLTYKGVPVVGVIYNPFMDQLVSRTAGVPISQKDLITSIPRPRGEEHG